MSNLDIIIPVQNEAANIPSLIERIDETLSSVTKYKIIFVLDPSTDGTEAIIEKYSKKYPIVLHKKIGKFGKAFSILEGANLSSAEYIVMIDGDLQYAPEAIPKMLAIAPKHGAVVANRKRYQGDPIRKWGSRIGSFLLGKFLFKFNCDIQSGLKLFRREIIAQIPAKSVGAWSLDLALLHTAVAMGYTIGTVDITFVKRKNGNSKVKFLSTAGDILSQAIHLKLQGEKIYPLEGDSVSMIGSGVIYKKKRFITHSALPHKSSALITWTWMQKSVLFIFIAAIVAGMFIDFKATLIGLIGLISFVYFIDLLLNFYLIMKSLHTPPELSFSEREVKSLQGKNLPVYSILCPLYKEARLIPQFVSSMEKFDWPKDKLDVLLLLEEDDKETLAAVKTMHLPRFIRTIIVPHSSPKTKPKACNYGLSFAKGEYIVIYDAEDAPDAQQLKKAYLGFKQSGNKVFCLQAKLNYYNPHHNLLTRLFTAEYSLWFDAILPGLQSIATGIPLGGTSNHFRTEDLRQLKGWDAFNVAEDCDLGIRLFKEGYQTAIIDSITLEEANSNFRNWIRQRSRWIKGYMQTYLVHMRNPLYFARKQGWRHFLIFQLVVGGKVLSMLINPLLWVLTLSYFLLYAYVGPTIESFYPPIVFYIAVFSLVVGNFLYLYYYMIGSAKRSHWTIVKYVFFVPFYWLAISIAAFMSAIQLVYKPHYWEKTIHGFHLDSKKQLLMIEEGFVNKEKSRFNIPSPRPSFGHIKTFLLNKRAYVGGAILVLTSIVANFLNFLFNVYLGRELDLQDFALISLIGGLLSFASVLFSAFSTTVNHRSGFIIGRYGDEAAYHFWRYVRKNSFFVSTIISCIWILMIPFLKHFFGTQDISIFVIFTLILFIGFASGVDSGFLSSKLMFGSMAVLNFTEPVIKMTAAVILVSLGLKLWTFAAIPLGIVSIFIIGWLLIIKQVKNKTHPDWQVSTKIKNFPKKFFTASLFTGFSSVAFTNLDIILANHYLTPVEAGRYALLSLAGKMVYFLGALTTPFVIPLISRNEGANKDSKKLLYVLLLCTFLLAGTGYIAFGIFGFLTLPILYGQKSLSILPYLTYFMFGMLCYSVSIVLKNYYLAKKVFSFTAVSILLVIVEVTLLVFHHENIGVFAMTMGFILTLNLVCISIMHFAIGYIQLIESNIVDFLGLFSKKETVDSAKLRILIFNWRDTKHKWAGGAEQYIHEISKRWLKLGIKVTLFCGNDGHSPKNQIIDGIHIIRRGGFYTVYMWAFLYYMLRFRGKFDIIIDSENGLPFFTPLYVKERAYLLIHHVHQEVFRKSLIKPLAWLALMLELKFMPLVYKNSEVITVSDSSRKEILQHDLTKKNPFVIHCGIDKELFKPGKKAASPLILYLGRLQYYKSLNVFIKAAKKVLESYPQAKFVIAGEGEEREKLQKYALRLGVRNKIHFLGRVTEEEKVRLYQKAWVFVNTSFMEGWGITTIEANACGTPVVASDVPGLQDSVQNNQTGFLVPYGNSDLFAKKIQLLIEDKQLAETMSKQALKWGDRFSWEKSAVEFYSVLINDLKLEVKPSIAKILTQLNNRI